MEAIAKRRNLKGSPRKTRLVIDLIRGRNVSQALAILKFTNKRAAKPITKLLRSAIANATYLAEQKNIAIDPDDLWVKSCFVDMGMHKNRRRLRPAPQGRAYQEQRHYCHITIMLSSDQPETPVTKLKKHGNKVNPAELDAKAEAAKIEGKTGRRKLKSRQQRKRKLKRLKKLSKSKRRQLKSPEQLKLRWLKTSGSRPKKKRLKRPEVETAEEVNSRLKLAEEATEEVSCGSCNGRSAG